ncbi:MAG TPA: helix-turn-helix transcriptional regulator [Bacillales bacterium]|nr:helix-turn-helix transcriptional regulator [Bacillales bacterium]
MDNILGSRIKYLREMHNYSQKQMAAQLDITNVQLSRYETGSRKPDPETIARIANFFEVPTDFLLGLATSVHDPKPMYLTATERAVLEVMKQNPNLAKILQEIAETPDSRIKTFIQMWNLFQSREE